MSQPAPAFLSKGQAKAAFEAFVLPSIEYAMRVKHVNREHMHVVVLKPCVPYTEGAELPILFEYSIGNRAYWEEWDGKSFGDFARAKAHLSWRTGLSSREVVLTKPHLLLHGDCRYWGSSVYGGYITGISGVEPFYDEMFATMTSAAMVGQASFYADKFSNDLNAPDFL